MFVAVMDDMDKNYDLVKKNLMTEDFADNYTHVHWEKYNIYIELQRLSARFVRLLYNREALYENYKDFLFKPCEGSRRQG